MTYAINETHNPRARSWIESANRADAQFPIQNLPYGVFRHNGSHPRIGVAIGDMVLDLKQSAEAKCLANLEKTIKLALSHDSLNDLMALTPRDWSSLRLALFRLLHESASASDQMKLQKFLAPINECDMEVPAKIGDYTDFYAGIFHATNVGSIFRPQNPLLPNYKWVPIAYHGRSSSIVCSGRDIVRPTGQRMPPGKDIPIFDASGQVDFELELGLYIGQENSLGCPVPIEIAEDRIFGVCLLNDWSARDIQSWEYQPLGPFLAKNFATSVSPWVVTLEALAPFRTPAFRKDTTDPQPLPYLSNTHDREHGGVDIQLEVLLTTAAMRRQGTPAFRLSRGSSQAMYWTIAQMVAHHTCNGCNLRPGDLLGTGTISGPHRDALGSLLEITRQGKEPLQLPTGEQRSFLEDGDELIVRGWCESEGKPRIGLGECRGILHPSAAVAI